MSIFISGSVFYSGLCFFIVISPSPCYSSTTKDTLQVYGVYSILSTQCFYAVTCNFLF